ncbi:hypothetical protein PR003_g25507 [Phytophthora rubi]|uniref:Uncharacterized protein n=1 Tax=Phytophthora rubi TaxID=129364 RepID=A0A6A3HN97_9STRA|nr:hypothetical protein PR002_g27258 [Phytophthora rubi]KAE9289622.1 hypothetical protein PR003_g25507 [Phytophthora rubi]
MKTPSATLNSLGYPDEASGGVRSSQTPLFFRIAVAGDEACEVCATALGDGSDAPSWRPSSDVPSWRPP